MLLLCGPTPQPGAKQWCLWLWLLPHLPQLSAAAGKQMCCPCLLPNVAALAMQVGCCCIRSSGQLVCCCLVVDCHHQGVPAAHIDCMHVCTCCQKLLHSSKLSCRGCCVQRRAPSRHGEQQQQQRCRPASVRGGVRNRCVLIPEMFGFLSILHKIESLSFSLELKPNSAVRRPGFCAGPTPRPFAFSSTKIRILKYPDSQTTASQQQTWPPQNQQRCQEEEAAAGRGR